MERGGEKVSVNLKVLNLLIFKLGFPLALKTFTAEAKLQFWGRQKVLVYEMGKHFRKLAEGAIRQFMAHPDLV